MDRRKRTARTVALMSLFTMTDIQENVPVASFDGDGSDLISLIVGIEPVQAGSGDPSPDNVRPISGWAECKVYVSPTTDPDDATVYSIGLDGTRYGGTLDVTQGKLTVNRAIKNVQISLGAYNETINALLFYSSAGVFSDASVPANNNTPFSAIAESININSASAINAGGYGIGLTTTKDIYLRTVGASSKDDYLSIFPNGINVVYELATPIVYDLAPTEINTLLGANNIWADTGEIKYIEYNV